MNFWEIKIKYFYLDSFFLRIISFFIFLGLLCWGCSTLKTSFYRIFCKKNAYIFLKENSGSFSVSGSTTSGVAGIQKKEGHSQLIVLDSVTYGELSQAQTDALFIAFFQKSKSTKVSKKISNLSKKPQKKEISKKNKKGLLLLPDKKNTFKKSKKGAIQVIKKPVQREKKELVFPMSQEFPLKNFPSPGEHKITLENKNAVCDITNQDLEKNNNTVVSSKKSVKLIDQEKEIIIHRSDDRSQLKEENEFAESPYIDLQAEQYHEMIQNYENRLIKYLLRYPGRLPSGQITIDYISEQRVSILSDSKPVSLGLRMYLNQIIKAISVPYFLIGKKVTIVL